MRTMDKMRFDVGEGARTLSDRKKELRISEGVPVVIGCFRALPKDKL